MASVRAGRDVGGMNDLPIPGQPGSNVPDFDINTMKLASPTPQPKVPPTPLPPDMTRFAPIPYSEPYHPMNIPPPPDPIDAKVSKLVAPQPQVPDAGVPNTGIPTLKPGSDQPPPPPPPPIDNTARNSQLIRGRPGIDPSTADTGGFARDGGGLGALAKAAAALGIPLAVAAMLFGRGRGGSAAELSKVLPEVTPALEDFRPRTYGDDTISPATDEARARVNDASGGQPVTQEGQDKVARQLDINSGKIKPQDYQQGEKPKPGTEGYKAWFKYRQQLSRGNRTAPQ